MYMSCIIKNKQHIQSILVSWTLIHVDKYTDHIKTHKLLAPASTHMVKLWGMGDHEVGIMDYEGEMSVCEPGIRIACNKLDYQTWI